MPVTYFKVKPESAMYKNFFIENTERKKLKKHISEFMKNHFGNGKHEVWTTLYPSLVMTLSSEKAKELSHQLCKGTLGDSQYVFKGNNGDWFYRFKKNSKTYKLWKDEVMAHINEDNLRANAFGDSISRTPFMRMPTCKWQPAETFMGPIPVTKAMSCISRKMSQ